LIDPSGDTAPEVYRRQAAKLEELEKENKRLAKEAQDAERRWKKAEEELEELREKDDGVKEESVSKTDDEEVKKLRDQITALERQNTQLSAAAKGRHGSSPSIAHAPPSNLQQELAAKENTIEAMEIEISNLRAQLSKALSGHGVEREQITALEEKLERSQKAEQQAESELKELKKNLERTTEKAVKEGSKATSAETKVRTLEKENADLQSETSELKKKLEALEKKASTLTTLHKEQDSRSQQLRKDKEKAEKEATELKAKLARIASDDPDSEAVDGLEDEARLKLQRKIRELEAEIFDLKRGHWRDGRRELQGDMDAGFTEVDLSTSPHRRRQSHAQGQSGFKWLGNLAGTITGAAPTHDDGESLLGDEDDFDEEAFRKAQEEEGRKRIERIREVKRGLEKWKGWRMDLVEVRRGVEGMGEVFEI
jgi:chromosome segregation ATPase